jgi:17beta-estradiol 17-dehydrogenase / very-long-chain 3-oxoacyl-CoA reductase
MVGISGLLIPILAGFGALTWLYTAYFVIRFMTFHFIKPAHPLHSYKRTGPEPTYALITGSSAGIGLGVAQALVKEGFAIILLGHLPEELAAAKRTLQTIRSDAAVEILVMDARTATPKEMATAVQSIADLQVSILVNNVGGIPIKLPTFRALVTYSSEDVDLVINQNARFMARLTALMLPILSRKSRTEDRSLILNMSSAGMVGLSWLVMYGATKAFNWAFSCGLARELELHPETTHIDSLAIIPGEVLSQGNSEGVSSSEPRWDEFGQCIVDKVDTAISRRMREMRPFMMHDIMYTILPEGTKTAGLKDAMIHKRDAFNSVYEKIR